MRFGSTHRKGSPVGAGFLSWMLTYVSMTGFCWQTGNLYLKNSVILRVGGGSTLQSHAQRAFLIVLIPMISLLFLPFLAYAINPFNAWPYDFNYNHAVVNVADIKPAGVAPEAIPALVNPAFIPVKKDKYLRYGDKVAVLKLNGDVRAYPLRVLRYHQVINDFIGQHHTVLAYSPLTGALVASDRYLDGRYVQFKVSGLVYNSDLLMFDRETRSLWSVLGRRAVSGIMSGTEMKTLPVSLVKWVDFKREYPEAEVLDMDAVSHGMGNGHGYEGDPYAQYTRQRGLLFPVTHHDYRLYEKLPVLGLSVYLPQGEKITVAFPASEVYKHTGSWQPIQLGDVTLQLHLEYPKGTLSVLAPQGVRVESTFAYWFAWAAFNPNTILMQTFPSVQASLQE